MDTVTVNRKELAQALRCSEPTVDRLIARYQDFPIVERGSNGKAYRFDLAEVRAYLLARKAEEEQAAAVRDELLGQLTLDLTGGTVADDGVQKLSPQQRLQAINAELRAIELQRVRGTLCQVDEVDVLFGEVVARLSRWLNNLPADIARRARLTGPAEQALKAALDEQRRQLAADLRAHLDQRRGSDAA